jgi:predicted MFS family arabinose efflux permease
MSVKYLLRWTYVDGVFFALMVATAESFALYFFARQGISKTDLAVLSTVPVLLAAVAQLLIPRLVPRARLGSGIAAMMLLQLLGLLALIYAAIAADHFWVPLVALSLYWTGGQCAGPLWIDWIAQYCPRADFERFFGKRTAAIQIVTLAVFLGFAYFIEWGLSYVWIFAFSALARLGSLTTFLYSLRKSKSLASANATVLAGEETFRRGDSHRTAVKIFAIFVLAGGVFRFAVNTSSPFFLTYMIENLKLTTIDYVWLSSVPLVGKVLFQINWARGRLQGYQYLGVQTSCIMISFLPWLWTLSDDFLYLIFIQAMSGLFWGGLEFMHVMLAQNLAYGQSRKYASVQQAVFQVCAVGGALLGGVLLDHKWLTQEVFNLSTGLRLVAAGGLAVFAWQYSWTRISLRGSFVYLSALISIRPSAANIWANIPIRLRRRGT